MKYPVTNPAIAPYVSTLNPMDRFGNPLPIKTWKGLQKCLIANFYPSSAAAGSNWLFRGQGNVGWGLSSSFERSLDQAGLGLLERAHDLEGGMLRRFQRQAAHFMGHLQPDQENLTEWFAWMQHFGAPTRLLDWTHSPYVGLYFAVEALALEDQVGVLWAIDWDWVDSLTKRQGWRKTDPNLVLRRNFKSVLQRRVDGVVKLNAFKMNERLVVQQGTFLVPTNVENSFEGNLVGALASYTGVPPIRRILVHYQARKEVMPQLLRMNVGSASLFPDLAGFAKSISDLITIDGLLRPGPNW